MLKDRGAHFRPTAPPSAAHPDDHSLVAAARKYLSPDKLVVFCAGDWDKKGGAGAEGGSLKQRRHRSNAEPHDRLQEPFAYGEF